MSQDNATKCSAADGVTQTFGFGHGTLIMVRAVDFNALYAEFQQLRMALAGISEEMGLPDTLGPAKGDLKRLLDNGKAARDLLAESMRTMKSLLEAATPDNSTEDMYATISGGAFAAFVDAHAALLYKIAHSSTAPKKEA